jgi:peptidoglycan hydrolase-like protein with peptidoglycan-binding domain
MSDFRSVLLDAVGNSFANKEEDVRYIKRRFKALGRLNEPDDVIEDGIITRELTSTIKTFQKENNLKEDGVIKPNGETEHTLAQLDTKKTPNDSSCSTFKRDLATEQSRLEGLSLDKQRAVEQHNPFLEKLREKERNLENIKGEVNLERASIASSGYMGLVGVGMSLGNHPKIIEAENTLNAARNAFKANEQAVVDLSDRMDKTIYKINNLQNKLKDC